MIIKKSEPNNSLESIKPKSINILDKNPLKGGIPATEKKIKINENAHKGFTLKKFDKLDKKRGVEIFLSNKLVFF